MTVAREGAPTMEEDTFASTSAKSLAEQADAKVIDKLSTNEAERLAERDRRKEEEARAADPRENVAKFLAKQQEQSAAVESAISEETGRSSARTPEEVEALRAKFDGLRQQLMRMEKAAAEASYFLPSYDIRSAAELGKELKAKVDHAQKSLLPRKGFSFSRKRAPPRKSQPPARASDRSEPTGPGDVSTSEGASDLLLTKSTKVKGAAGEVVVLREEDIATNDVEIIDSKGCTFYIIGKLVALRLVRLHECKVYCGPVDGSLYAQFLQGCVVMAAAHQIRIHDSTLTDFYLRVRSHPIIEKCTEVRFAPYRFAYASAGQEEQLKQAQLGDENGLWADVKDFGWLKTTQSPNWSVINEGEQQREHWQA